MNRFLTFIAGAVACHTISTASAQTPLTLFPLNKGSKWTIAMQVAGRQTAQDITVTDVKSSGGAKTATVDYKMNGKTMQTEVYRIDGKGISRLRAGVGNGGSLSPALLVIPANAKTGAKWNWKGTINIQGRSIPASADFILMAPESVSVPAGKFKAHRVRFFLTMNTGATPTRVENSYWFAPNVGMVKQEIKIGPQAITGVLTKYNVVK